MMRLREARAGGLESVEKTAPTMAGRASNAAPAIGPAPRESVSRHLRSGRAGGAGRKGPGLALLPGRRRRGRSCEEGRRLRCC